MNIIKFLIIALQWQFFKQQIMLIYLLDYQMRHTEVSFPIQTSSCQTLHTYRQILIIAKYLLSYTSIYVGAGLLCLFFIMLCCSAHKIYLGYVSLLSLFTYISIIKAVLLGCIYKWQQRSLYVLLDNYCSIRVYQSFVVIFSKLFPIMLALMLNAFSDLLCSKLC